MVSVCVAHDHRETEVISISNSVLFNIGTIHFDTVNNLNMAKTAQM